MSYIYDMTASDLEKHLIGKVITKVDEQENSLTLSDGTVLTFKDTADCCAWFSAELSAGNLTDNAITSLTVEDHDDPDGIENYSIHILAADKNVVDLGIRGDATSGYYCHSINLDITTPEGK